MNTTLEKRRGSQAAPSTLIVGLGKTGLSCARFLNAHGVPVAVTDSRAHPPEETRLQQELPQIALHAGGFERSLFEAAERLVVSPGISLHEPLIAGAAARGVPVIGDIELFARHAQAPVAAITGTNGKSTVTMLVREMAHQDGRDVRTGGNLGTPALDLLAGGQPEAYLLELSSFQLETTHSLNAAVAAILNVSPDHLDRYADVEEYVAAKRRIYRGDGVMVINVDDPVVRRMAEPGRRVVRFGLEAPAPEDFGVFEHHGEPWLARGSEPWLAARELHIPGSHNRANALAALAVGDVMGFSQQAMVSALRAFTGLPHRCQWVTDVNGAAWYNDSKGTNVGATAASISGMDGPLVLIAGGEGKDADFTPLREAVRGKVRTVVLLGQAAPRIEAALGGEVAVVHAGDMDAAVDAARRAARPGDSVLLSPACASFDMFRNFEERGEAFCAAVRRLL